jgi:ABC-type molybdate transport system substrate-binding protein
VRSSAPTGGLVVLCGAGLRAPMEECRKEFERRHRVSVRVVYGGSQCLLAQIAITYRNALIDIYAPGEEFYAKQAQDRGYVTIYKPMAYFIPVIMVREATQRRSARCKTWRSRACASASASRRRAPWARRRRTS